jgi:NarL family two-component system sensor histidine kinase LiaS
MRRIIEEALDNVVKHAHAKSAIVMLRRRDDGRICLDVIDNGRGFLANGAPDTIGLLAMKHYSAELGGVFRVASIPGQGTIVRVIL